jgi:RimJ/RimL family protein N-acetyltransferase
LKPIERSDYSDYVRWNKNRESVGEFDLLNPNLSEEDIFHYLDTLGENKIETFIIVKNGSKKNIGWIDCILPDKASFVVQIGYTIREVSERRKHYATEAIKLVLEYLFSKPDTNRVQATVDPENPASWRALRSNGFEREGKLRGYWKTESGFRDQLIFGITKSIWENSKVSK